MTGHGADLEGEAACRSAGGRRGRLRGLVAHHTWSGYGSRGPLCSDVRRIGSSNGCPASEIRAGVPRWNSDDAEAATFFPTRPAGAPIHADIVGDKPAMVFMIFAGFVVALVAGRYLGDSDQRISTVLTRSRFSKP